MGTNRRKFLKNLVLGGCGSAVHATGFGRLRGWANKMTSATSVSSDKLLIVLELGGGISPTFAPSSNLQEYWSLTWPDTTYQLAGQQLLHGKLSACKDLYDRGEMCVLNMVDFEGPHGSHGGSTLVWETGIVGKRDNNLGWMTRASCAVGEQYAAMSLIRKTPMVQGFCDTIGISNSFEPTSLDSLSAVGEVPNMYAITTNNQINNSGYTLFAKQLLDKGVYGSRLNSGQEPNSNSPALDYLYKEAYDLESMLVNLSSIQDINTSANAELQAVRNTINGILAAEPLVHDERGRELLRDAIDVVKIINSAQSVGDFNPRMLLFGCGGFDTHDTEKATLAELLEKVNLAIDYIAKACRALGIWDKVVIVTASEFSRAAISIKDVGSDINKVGSAHGYSGPMLIMGGGINGGSNGYVTRIPEIGTDFYQRYSYSDAKYVNTVEIDFRQIYWEVLNQHLGFDLDTLGNTIFPEQFPRDQDLSNRLFKI